MRLKRGASIAPGGTTFSVWVPNATSVAAHVATGDGRGDHALAPSTTERGVWATTVEGVRAGDRYGFRVDGSDPLPDPVSRSQPEGVHALSEVIDPAEFAWTDAHWNGVSLPDFVIYEIHVGTFTPEGSFDAAAARLAELAALGITAVELMPLASFPGRRNWGYDGVHVYAPQHSYGGVDGFKRFVNAAHEHGLGVVLDVVFNHVGPEGNYLDRFGPYFTDVYRTPWGRAMNYDGPGSDAVRDWAHANALYWVSEYHVDALRLDAVHGIFDFGALTFLEELSDEVHELGRQLGRKVQLLAESDLNDPRLVRSPAHGGFGLDAQWADDFHHTVHASLTGERNGYYGDFSDVATIADVYREPFFFARRYSTHRNRVHGRSSVGMPRQRFVVALQNHDQVGNRPNGERLAVLLSAGQLRLAAALLLLSPYVPLMFMGEEYGETAPFLYFIDHGDPGLTDAVRDGRRREFASIGLSDTPNDPASPATFEQCRLDWSARDAEPGVQRLALYRDLLALRREEPALRPGGSTIDVHGTHECFTALRLITAEYAEYETNLSQRDVFCAFNLAANPATVPVPPSASGSWRLRLSTDAQGYGGTAEHAVNEFIPAEAFPARLDDAPKRLLDPPEPAERGRMVHLPAWSAAVYVRDVESGWERPAQ